MEGWDSWYLISLPLFLFFCLSSCQYLSSCQFILYQINSVRDTSLYTLPLLIYPSQSVPLFASLLTRSPSSFFCHLSIWNSLNNASLKKPIVYLIGKKDTIWENGVYPITITFPAEYPSKPYVDIFFPFVMDTI
jgi:hypothetical protein